MGRHKRWVERATSKDMGRRQGGYRASRCSIRRRLSGFEEGEKDSESVTLHRAPQASTD